jgi:uncharacterized protein (TIRG00374 family)
MFFLKLVFTLFLLGVIVWYLEDFGKFTRLITSLSPAYFLFLYAVNTFDRALMTFKWGLLLHSRGLRLPFFAGLKIYCAAMIWGMFLPATIGADAFRALSTSRLGLDAKEVVASILIERLVGFLSALLLGMFGLTFLSLSGYLDDEFRLIWWIGGAMLVGVTVAFTASFSQDLFTFLYDRLLYRFREFRILQRFRQFHTTYQKYQQNRHVIMLFFGLTMCQQLLMHLSIWMIAQGLGIKVNLLYIAGAVPLTFLIARLPVTINGLGVFDGLFILFMSKAGVSGTEAIAIVVVGRALEILSWLPWWAAQTLYPDRQPVGISKGV